MTSKKNSCKCRGERNKGWGRHSCLPALSMVSAMLFAALSSIAAEITEPKVPDSVLAAVAALPPEAKPQEIKAAQNGAIYARLANGCEIIVKEKHSAPVVSVQAWVRTGAIDEGKWMGAGLSHFCEHMLFKGTTNRPTGKIDQDIRGAGGDDNAYTTSERTVYHVTGAADGFDTAFDVISDMVMNSTFPPEEAVKEHAVVYKEIERYLDNPDAVLYEAYEKTLFQEHPYRVPVLGYPDRFKRVTREEVYAYYQERYTPDLTTFITVGDFDAATVLPKIAKVAATWVRKSVAPQPIPPEPEQVAPRFVSVTHPLCEVPKLVMGWPSVSIRNPDLYALDLLASILGDGRPSRLYRTVKDKQGLVLEVSASDYTPNYMGHFDIWATVEPDKIEDAKAAILKIIEESKTQKPSDEELARAKRKVYTNHVFAQMTSDGEAGNLGSDWFSAGDLDFSEHYSEHMQQVTADDIIRVAKKYLAPEKLTIGVMLPVEKDAKKIVAAKTDDKKAQQDALNAELASLKGDGGVAKADLLADKAVFEFMLKPSGVRVVVREDHSLPVVNIALASLGGTRWEPAELAGAGNLLSEMLDRGTAKRNKFKVAEETEDLGASLSTFTGRNSFGLEIKGLRNDLPKLMDLISDSMLHPAFDKEELEKLRADTLQQIAQEDESLFTLNTKILRPMLYGDHPYARQNLGTPETVAKVSVDDLKKLHTAWVQPENLALSFVGDITALDALKLAQQYLGQLKTGAFKAPAVPPVPQIGGAKSGQGEKAGITGAILTLGYRGVGLKSPERETLDLMVGLLSGLGGRLNIALREKQGLAYSCGVYNDSQLDGGALVFYIQTDAQSLDKSYAGMLDEAGKLRTELVPKKEIDAVKNYLVGTEAIELQNQGELAQRLALAQLYDEGAAHVFGRKARLEKVTAEDVKAAAVKFLDEKNNAKAILKPK